MDLRQLLTTLRRRWKLATAVLLLAVGGAALATSLITPSYVSSTRIYIAASGSGSLDPYQLGIYAAQRVASYADLAKDSAVLQKVIDETGISDTPEQLAKRITTEAVPNSVILEVSVRDTSPKVAQVIAKAVSQQISLLVSDLERPEPTEDEPRPQSPIEAKVAGEPSYDPAPVSPNLILNLVVGTLLGAIVGVGAAVLREIFDDTVKSPEELSEVTGSAVMTVVPFDSSVTKHPLISDDDAPATRGEPFRVLRTNLQFAEIDGRQQTLLVTSAVPDEGKTVTAVNLALALAQAGRDVLLIDGDLRKPNVARMLGLDNAVGLMTVLFGSADLSSCVQRHSSGLHVLGTGPQPPNPAEVLETDALKDLLNRARGEYDVVIIDAPPLLPVADPAIIAARVNGVLLVTRYGSTSRDLVRQSVARLHGVGAKVVGVALTMSPRATGDAYGYGYGYGYGQSVAEPNGGKRKAEAEADREPRRRASKVR